MRIGAAITLTLALGLILGSSLDFNRRLNSTARSQGPSDLLPNITATQQDIRSIIGVKVPSTNFSDDPFRCVQARYKSVTFPMCLHSDKECKIISKTIHNSNGQLFELQEVDDIINVLENDPEMGLIDVGANIGTYTLPAAHMNHKVVAVEMNFRTANRLMASISKGNITDKVSLHQVAISNGRERLRMLIRKGNIGDSRLVNERACFEKNPGYIFYYCDDQVVNSIVMDDLLLVINFTKAVIKIDAQGSEWLALQNASKLFDKVDIQMVLLEWDDFYGRTLRQITWDELYGTNERDKRLNDAKKADIIQMVDFFLTRGYAPYDKYGNRYDTSFKAMLRWPYNLLLKKQSRTTKQP